MAWRRRLLAASLLLLAPWLLADDLRLQGFFDGVMQSHLSAQRTVGATVAVVQDGQVLLTAGYGQADLANAQPVDPVDTLFRVGSISKVLVWMSVLQQLERAGASLDEDVSNYLESVQLQHQPMAPVTLRHLMTHTPGFEDRVYGLFTDSFSRLPSLEDYLRKNVPRQVWLPGSTVAYSNYGAALAARIVENLSSMEFEAYAQQAIFAPLNMRSTFAQRFDGPLRERLARGYVMQGGRPEQRPLEYVVPAPAGALSASADDMARLMLELLASEPSAVLSDQAREMLLARADSANPALNGRTLGLYEMSQGDGERAVGHDGATMLFHSRMVLWPAQRLGLFISTNTDTGGAVVNNLVAAFAARQGFVPAPVLAPEVVDLNPVAGVYGASRREFSGPLKLLSLTSQIRVQAVAEGTRLRVSGAAPTAIYEPRGGQLYYANNSAARLFIKRRRDGRDQLYSSTIPVVGYERLPWYEQARFNVGFLVLVALINLLVLLRYPYTALVRGGAGQYRTGPLASVCAWLLALGVFAAVVAYVRAVPDAVTFMLSGHRDLGTINWLIAPLAVGALVLVLFVPRVWSRGYWWRARRWGYTLAAAANLALIGWMLFWNLQPLSIPSAP